MPGAKSFALPLIFLSAGLAFVPSTEPVQACGMAYPRDFEAAVADETALIVYDSATKTEHFLRLASQPVRDGPESQVPTSGTNQTGGCGRVDLAEGSQLSRDKTLPSIARIAADPLRADAHAARQVRRVASGSAPARGRMDWRLKKL